MPPLLRIDFDHVKRRQNEHDCYDCQGAHQQPKNGAAEAAYYPN
jgi:hypothetical protein